MKESFYFPHDNDARNDDRILELRSCYGNDGYALFFYTLESMSQSEDGGINRVAIGGLSLGYGVDKGMLEGFYQKCIDLGLFFEENGKIFSERMLHHKSARRELSEAGKRGAAKRWKNSPPISPPKGNPIARKGKERKGNNIIKHIIPTDIESKEVEEKIDPKKIQADFLASLRTAVGVDKFKDENEWTEAKRTLTVMEKIGKDDFLIRMKGVLADSFKAKNCNRLSYLRKEIESFIHSPIVQTVDKSGKVSKENIETL